MFCSNCGKEIDDNANFCQFCGYQFSPKDVVARNDIEEYLIYNAKKHWITLIPCFIWGFLAIVIFFAALNTKEDIYWIYLFSFCFLSVYPYLRYKFDKIEITNKSFNLQQGIFNIDRINMPLSKINTYYINQGLLGRILNYGSFIFQSGAKAGNSSYNFIENPHKLINIMNNIENYKR